MKYFDVPLTENDWDHKWYVDVHNIYSSKKINDMCPLEISEGHTQGISRLRYRFWETIWYFKECKDPEILGNQKY